MDNAVVECSPGAVLAYCRKNTMIRVRVVGSCGVVNRAQQESRRVLIEYLEGDRQGERDAVARGYLWSLDDYDDWQRRREDERELTHELAAQAQALNLTKEQDGVSCRVIGDSGMLRVDAHGEAASMLIKLLRETYRNDKPKDPRQLF